MNERKLLGWAVGTVAVVGAFALGTAVVSGGGTNGWWMPHMGAGGWMGPGTAGWMGMGGWGLGMLFVGLLWTALLVGVPVAVTYWFLARREDGRTDPAMDELRERYARGEIDEAEFESRKRRLSGQ
ncbi:SHOCT domain-containing protein [Halogeometricum luteum]|uniref:SHOCT domain-containing protein n=1 Tax=Halogeometricum luteum TaxID=2950537 RepID=A0ABU2G241_9EURY|nr:SHOCT domain-containing protein [Halogeometricum sp. S3BR5-2]MDS0294843.1 SHOCT domain-containing protein [Halogeometricum sp. S3BR5-2]